MFPFPFCCTVKEPSAGYALARMLLKDRFGNDYNVSDAWIEKILSRPDVTDNKGLLDLSDDLRNCRETLETMGKMAELNNRQSLFKIVDKLPFSLKKEWLNKVYHIKHAERRLPTIDDVMLFVSSAAERANDPVFGKLLSQDRPDKARKGTKPRDAKPDKRRANFNTYVHQPATCSQQRSQPEMGSPATPV